MLQLEPTAAFFIHGSVFIAAWVHPQCSFEKGRVNSVGATNMMLHKDSTYGFQHCSARVMTWCRGKCKNEGVRTTFCSQQLQLYLEHRLFSFYLLLFSSAGAWAFVCEERVEIAWLHTCLCLGKSKKKVHTILFVPDVAWLMIFFLRSDNFSFVIKWEYYRTGFANVADRKHTVIVKLLFA